jgi:hypothetical protein
MKERLPDITKGGVLIGGANPQPEIRKNAETNRNWEYQPIADKWYPIAEEIKQTLFDGVLLLDRTSPLPSPPIAIEPMNVRTLATYRLVEDGYGLNDKLTLNAKHFKKVNGVWVWDYGGDWGLGETITHEIGHEKHKHWGTTKPDHDKYFIDMMEQIGIHCNQYGQHWKEADEEKAFSLLMHRLFIPRTIVEFELPENSKVSWWTPDGPKKEGTSTINKWQCPVCDEIWYCTRKDPKPPKHEECGVFFVRAGDLAQAMLGINKKP